MDLIVNSLKTACHRICAVSMVTEARPVMDHMEQSNRIICGLFLSVSQGAIKKLSCQRSE